MVTFHALTLGLFALASAVSAAPMERLRGVSQKLAVRAPGMALQARGHSSSGGGGGYDWPGACGGCVTTVHQCAPKCQSAIGSGKGDTWIVGEITSILKEVEDELEAIYEEVEKLEWEIGYAVEEIEDELAQILAALEWLLKQLQPSCKKVKGLQGCLDGWKQRCQGHVKKMCQGFKCNTTTILGLVEGLLGGISITGIFSITL